MTLTRQLAFAPLALLVACTSSDDPDREPPPSWGVPITGGTMLVTKAGGHVVISDPDRDRLVSVDLATRATTEIPLRAGDEPGRLVEDGAGRIHVALRRGGAIVTLDSATATQVSARRDVCREPRGLAWDTTGDVVHVACTGGELISLPAAGGAATRRLQVDRDLRDVVVLGNKLVISRFRSSEVLTLDAAGVVTERITPPGGLFFRDLTDDESSPPGPPEVRAAIAWRMISAGDGRVLMTHQRQVGRDLEESDDGYGGDCGAPVQSALLLYAPGQRVQGVRLPFKGALPVDVAVSPQGDRFAVVTAGDHRIHVLESVSLNEEEFPDCRGEPDPDPDDDGDDGTARTGDFNDQLGAPTSIAFTPGGDLITLYPELPAIVVRSATGKQAIPLPGEFGYDAGRAVFHRQTGVGMACASCHAEGRDDGLTWVFDQTKVRRTQSLAGNILARGPYHWSGDQRNLSALMDEVFSSRMAGGPTTATEKLSIGPWLDRIPVPAPVSVDTASAARGKTLYDSAEVGCASCHGGALLTNNTRVQVRAGDLALKVPSLLGLSARPPYMHDGCAATIADRFGACGGGDMHGRTSQLSGAQLADLIAYLESI